MQGMKGMTKKDLYEFINENFADKRDNEVIATFFYCGDGYKEPQQQCIMFREEIYNPC